MWPFRRRKTEQRAVTDVPWIEGGPRSPSIPSPERALRLTPVFAANRFLADQISTLPLKAYRRLGERREPMGALPQLFQFDPLETGETVVSWLTKAVYSLAIYGNAIGYITRRDGFAFPTRVDWRPRTEFFVDDSRPAMPQWYWNGRRVDRRDFVHIPWLSAPGKTLGLSPLEAFALAVDAGWHAQQYGSDWFANGGVPPATFKNSAKTLQAKDASVIRERLAASIRTKQPLVYGSDWDFNPITIPAEHAQFVESQKLTANQIAAIYGIEPEEIGGEAANSLTYNNEEMRQTKRVANLRPWLTRLEDGFSAVLPERQYVRFNADAVIRADLKTRHEVHKIDREIGLHNIDEIRALEDEPPLPDGQGKDYTPLGQAKPAEPAPAEPQATEEPPAQVNGHRPAVPVK